MMVKMYEIVGNLKLQITDIQKRFDPHTQPTYSFNNILKLLHHIQPFLHQFHTSTMANKNNC